MLTLLPKGAKNLEGREFDDLTALYITGTEPGQGAIWQCQCRCGELRLVAAMRLLAGDVKCCETCARQRRTIQLLASSKEARSRRAVLPSNSSDYARNWELYLEQMTAEQRAVYDDLIERRRRLNIRITPRIQADAVEVAYIECPMRKAA